MTISTAKQNDIIAIMELAKSTEAAPHWTLAHYQEAVQNSSSHLALVAEFNNVVFGFVIASGVDKEWELVNIVVAKESRGKGAASQLFQELIVQLLSRNVEALHLEVREMNTAAIALYKKFRFQQTGRRNGYYAAPAEDALLFRKDLTL